jgi:hypothetical protein
LEKYGKPTKELERCMARDGRKEAVVHDWMRMKRKADGKPTLQDILLEKGYQSATDFVSSGKLEDISKLMENSEEFANEVRAVSRWNPSTKAGKRATELWNKYVQVKFPAQHD